MGPGLITGASDDDPSGIGTYSVAGAAYGYGMLWLALVTYPMMAVVQATCARIGMATGRGLGSVIKSYYPSWVIYPTCLLLLVANTINIGADLGAMAASVNLFTGWPRAVVVVPLACAVVGLLVFARYQAIVAVFKWLTLSLFAYVVTGLIVRPDWADVLRHTFVPEFRWDASFISTVVAILGTTISPYLFFWQTSQEVEEEVARGRASVRQRRGATPVEVRRRYLDVGVGMGVSNLVMYFIILTAGATLFAHGQRDIADAATAAQALAPLAGPAAGALFGLALLFTGLLAIPVLAGSAAYLLSEVFGWKMGLNRPVRRVAQFYAVMAGATFAGLAFNLLPVDPIRALVLSAALNGVIAPVLLALIVPIAASSRVMGRLVSSWPSKVLGWFTTGVMAAAAVTLFLTLKAAS